VLFNSATFLFGFLPATLLIVRVVLWRGRVQATYTLIVASLIFYAWWKHDDIGAMTETLGAIGASIAVNFVVARRVARCREPRKRLVLLWIGLAFNLLLLGYFKYTNFLVQNVATLLDIPTRRLEIALPLGISFYSFQQIAFLVDAYRGQLTELRLREYVVTVLFFPHLIAGPLIHYRDIIPQFARQFRIGATTIWIGLPFFAAGLAKKVLIADSLAAFVSPLFARAETVPLEFFTAWTAALGYTTQLYFDFSGYSDMAIGLGLMFGIVLPLNFNSPYKSRSIIEFWRRWHMTLSGFLREYLYIPLGGGRVVQLRRYTNLLVVMLLGGLWHGAGWTFVAWGALHGVYLGVNHFWRDMMGAHLAGRHRMLGPISWLLTFAAVVVAWVFFRATTFTAALHVLAGMIGRAGIYSPWIGQTDGYRMPISEMGPAAIVITFAYVIALASPNTFQLFGSDVRLRGEPLPRWGTGAMRAAVIGALLWLSCFGVFGAAPSEFLYFQF
jgi:alginate O-acetyltransferase complex protein AlgI